MHREGKEMAVRVAFICLQFKLRNVLSRNETPIFKTTTHIILIIDSAQLVTVICWALKRHRRKEEVSIPAT